MRKMHYSHPCSLFHRERNANGKLLCFDQVGKQNIFQHSSLTCAVKGEEEEEQACNKVPQESHNSTGDAFGDRVHRLDEKLEEYWHTAVNKNANQDAGSVQDGYEKERERKKQTAEA